MIELLILALGLEAVVGAAWILNQHRQIKAQERHATYLWGKYRELEEDLRQSQHLLAQRAALAETKLDEQKKEYDAMVRSYEKIKDYFDTQLRGLLNWGRGLVDKVADLEDRLATRPISGASGWQGTPGSGGRRRHWGHRTGGL